MSIESAKEFLERIKNDEAFRKEMGNLNTPEERMEKATAYGFQFTKDELDQAKGDMLDDSELDAVAGGGWGCGCTHESEAHCEVPPL